MLEARKRVNKDSYETACLNTWHVINVSNMNRRKTWFQTTSAVSTHFFGKLKKTPNLYFFFFNVLSVMLVNYSKISQLWQMGVVTLYIFTFGIVGELLTKTDYENKHCLT